MSATREQEWLTLVEGGEARFCVQIVPPQDAEAVRTAMDELTEHLRACLGAPVRWFDRWASDLPPARLVLHLDVQGELEGEAFAIAADETSLTLRAGTVRGLEHAVHLLLERAFGVRWLWPGELGTVLPPARDVRWPRGETRHAPSFHWRRLWVGGAWWKEEDAYLAEQKFGGVSASNVQAMFRWQWRNRMGGLHVADGHRWAEICSPLTYAQSHPEYFALVNGRRDTDYDDGKHNNQPCTSNPEVVRLTADYIKAQFRARPDLDAFSIATNDGLGFCECSRCLEIDEWAGSEAHESDAFDALTAEASPASQREDQRVITDRMLLFANQVAEQVAEAFPDKLLLTLIYSVYRTPPRRVTLHPNVIAQFCSMGFTHANDAVYQAEMGVFEQLGRFADRLGLYEYYINGANGSLPRGFARTVARSLRRYHTLGARYFASQASLDFALDGFNYYLAGRLLWDINAEVDAVLDDYCRAGFGAAAFDVKACLSAFMDRWEEHWPQTGAEDRQLERLAGALYPQAWRAQRRAELDRAARAVADDEPARQRVAFLREGLDFLDLLVDACEAALPVFDQHARAASEAQVERAAATRDALLRWVESHRDGFWISATWFDYQRICRNGLLNRPLPVGSGERA